MMNLKDNINNWFECYHIRFVFILSFLLCFVGLFNRDLWTPDEPRVAAVSLAMSRSGDVIVPMLANEPFIEKPPLYFAVAGMFHKVFSSFVGDTAAIRLSTTFWVLGILWITYLLGKQFLGKKNAWITLGVMATMEGFFENSLWIRVDAALSFFVIASIWALVQVYFKQRRWYALLAGLFAAGAFLAKGPIGLIMIAIALIVMCVQTLFLGGDAGLGFRIKGCWKRFLSLGIIAHILALIVMVAIISPWVYLLYKSGVGVWQEWFWDNQVGRMLGTTKHLSHIHKGEPFYYISSLLVFSLPWTPVLIPWFWNKIKRLFRRTQLTNTEMFLFGWAVVGLVVLTSSATKRSIYIWPMMPVFALIIADQLTKKHGKWLDIYTHVWQGIMITVLFVLALLPLLAIIIPPISDAIPVRSGAVLLNFGISNIFVLLAVAVLSVLMLFIKQERMLPGILAISTAIFWGAAFQIAGPAVNRAKSMHDGVIEFVNNIPQEERDTVACYGFSETMRAVFFYYSDWSIPRLDAHIPGGHLNKEAADGRKEVMLVLQGEHPKYKSVIYGCKRKVVLGEDMPPAKILQNEFINKKRVLARFTKF